MKGVVYEGVRLMPGSKAFELHQDGKKKELAKHMLELDKKQRAMEGTPYSERTERFLETCLPCCDNEKRGMNGGCKSCGDPCF